MKTKIAVLVSGGGTNLEALLKAQEDGRIPHGQITLVVSNVAGAYALERAKNHGVCGICIPKKGKTQAEFEAAMQAALEENDIQMLILAGFLAILSENFVKNWENRIINVHPSLIPAFCGEGMYGLRVHEAALQKGVKVTGATVHYVNEIPDGGKILLQKAVEILPGDTPQILQRRVMEQAEWLLLPQAAEMVAKQLMEEK